MELSIKKTWQEYVTKAFKSCMAMVVMLVMVCFVMTSCTAEQKLKAAVKEANKEMPMELSPGMTCTSVVMSDGYVIYNVEVDEDFFDISLLRQNKEEMHTVMVMGLSELEDEDEDIKELVDICMETGVGIEFRFEGDQSGKSCSIRISASELNGKSTSLSEDDDEVVEEEAVEEETVVDYNALLSVAVNETKGELPMNIGGGMTFSDIGVSGDYVVFYYQCDEDLLDISALNAAKTEIKESVMQEWRTNDESKVFMGICEKADKGVQLKYAGNQSGSVCNIYISNSELANL